MGLAALALCLVAAAPAAAVSIGVQLLVGITGKPCPQPSCTAFGAADEPSNTPLDLLVAPGDELTVLVKLDFGAEMRQYESLVTLDTGSLTFVSATDISTLGFSALADPNDTLTDGTPGSGDADSSFCDPLTCTAPSTDTLYRLIFTVDPGFTPDALRDLTVGVGSIQYVDGGDSLDPARDTASLRLQLVPEPGTGLLLALGLVGLARRGRGARR